MKKKSILMNSVGTAITCCGLLVLGTDTADAATKLVGSVSGKAYGVSINLKGLVGLVNLKLGPLPLVTLPSTGGFVSEALVSLNLPDVIDSHTLFNGVSGKIGNSKAGSAGFSAVEDLDLLDGLIHADLIASVCSSYADGTKAGSDAVSHLVNLKVGTQTINVSTPPNTRINLVDGVVKLGTITFNEQVKSGDGGQKSSIVNNALHLRLGSWLSSYGLLGGDVVISSAQCGVDAKLVTDTPSSGGSISGAGSFKCGDHDYALFNFNASAAKAQLDYTDTEKNLKVVGTSLTSFVINNKNCATFKGKAKINGKDGYSYAVQACDYKDPGINADTFKINLSNGYAKLSYLDGGNVQIHLP